MSLAEKSNHNLGEMGSSGKLRGNAEFQTLLHK